ncbi:MAG: hypothetical protein IJ058_10445 [Lachnospiraceae bacterium]|nr:hypothetical protein [Lachnospiraceae bacterium]
MDPKMAEKAQEIVTKIQNDPALLKEFEAAPAKTIEKVAGINIPGFLEPKIEQIVKEQMKNGGNTDPMDIIKKFL